MPFRYNYRPHIYSSHFILFCFVFIWNNSIKKDLGRMEGFFFKMIKNFTVGRFMLSKLIFFKWKKTTLDEILTMWPLSKCLSGFLPSQSSISLWLLLMTECSYDFSEYHSLPIRGPWAPVQPFDQMGSQYLFSGFFIVINPIPYGISIPAMLRGGVFFTPPAKNILRSDRFKFIYTYQ